MWAQTEADLEIWLRLHSIRLAEVFEVSPQTVQRLILLVALSAVLLRRLHPLASWHPFPLQVVVPIRRFFPRTVS